MEEAAELDALEDAPQKIVLEDYPEESTITDKLLAHDTALVALFEGGVAAVVPIRPISATKVGYMPADASAEGFGAGTQYPDLVFESRDGLWDPVYAIGGYNL